MRSRRKSLPDRLADLAPAIVFVGAAIASVYLAMNILVTAPPVAIDRSVPPTRTAISSFGASPSLMPLVQATSEDTPYPTASLTDQQPIFVHSVIKDSDPHGVWSYYFMYPAFKVGETPFASQIDSDIRTDINARAQQWVAGPASERWERGRNNTLIGDFNTEMVTPEIASWTLSWADDSSPAGIVHGLESLNFDLASGRRMSLADIFIDDTSAVTVFSDVAPNLLRDTLGSAYDASNVAAGTSPLLSNFNNWGITRQGIRLTFNQYQVTSSGPALPTIVIPWSQLKSVMLDTGPVARLVGLEG